MPLTMTLEINHPRGEPDVFAPRFTCDHCGKPIDDARNGNAEWAVGLPRGEQTTWPVAFTHKACTEPFRRASNRYHDWMWQPLDDFLTYLLNNSGMNKRTTKRMPSTI